MASSVSCFAADDILGKCTATRKPQTKDDLTIDGWFRKGRGRFCYDKNVRLTNRGNKRVPADSDCDLVTRTMEQCKPYRGFGLASMVGSRVGDAEDEAGDVVVSSNCYWRKYSKEQRGKDQQGSCFAGGMGCGYDYENCVGGCTQDERSEGRWPGFLITHYTHMLGGDERELFSQKSIGDSKNWLVAEVDHSSTCPTLGKKPPRVNSSACSLSNIAECTYAVDAIVGGCSDRECVNGNLDSFFSRTREFLNPGNEPKSALVSWYESNAEPAATILEKPQMIGRNRVLAMLIEGAGVAGRCGDPDRSCMARLQTADCLKISRFATEVQQESGTMYAALKKLSRVCLAEAN